MNEKELVAFILMIHQHLIDDNQDALNKLLAEDTIKSELYAVALLRSTFTYKDKLANWPLYLERAKASIENAHKVLHGLF